MGCRLIADGYRLLAIEGVTTETQRHGGEVRSAPLIAHLLGSGMLADLPQIKPSPVATRTIVYPCTCLVSVTLAA